MVEPGARSRRDVPGRTRADASNEIWAGEIPIATSFGAAVASPGLSSGIPLSASVGCSRRRNRNSSSFCAGLELRWVTGGPRVLASMRCERRHILGAAAVMSALVVAACGGDNSASDDADGGAGGAARNGGSITIAQTSQPDFLDPAL